MGQATVDLPDPSADAKPTLTPPAGQQRAPATTDDLLSQLAGEEIDRLLADAETQIPPNPLPDAADDPDAVDPEAAQTLLDSNTADVELAARGITLPPEPVIEANQPVERPKSAADDADFLRELDAAAPGAFGPATASPIAPAPAVKESSTTPTSDADPAVESQLDELFAELNKPVGPAAIATDSFTGTSNGSSSAKVSEIDKLFEQLSAPITPTEPAPVALPGEVTAAPVAASAATGAASPPAAPARATIADLAAVLDPAVANKATSASSDQGDDEPLPVWLRPLAWINRPFENLSDDVRALLGQAAIMTALNALAVILYVVIFRR